MTGYLKLKYSKLEFIIAKLSVKYDGFTDYLFNKAHDYFSLGYREFKIYLFLYCLFDGRPQDYSEELDSFRGIVRHDFNKYLSGKPLILVHTHSKTVEEIRIFLSFLKTSIFLSKNPILYFFVKFFKSRERQKFIKSFL